MLDGANHQFGKGIERRERKRYYGWIGEGGAL